jgi:hypothetical protein
VLMVVVLETSVPVMNYSQVQHVILKSVLSFVTMLQEMVSVHRYCRYFYDVFNSYVNVMNYLLRGNM